MPSTSDSSANEPPSVATLRALADRSAFKLSTDQADAWDDISTQPVGDLPALRAFFDPPSVFHTR